MKKSQYDVAVLGATGAVGAELVELLGQRGFRLGKLRLFATENSAGEEVEGTDAVVEALSDRTDLEGADLVFSVCGEEPGRAWIARAVQGGAFAIDLAAVSCEHPQVPLVVPEVNPEALREAMALRVVGSPDPAAIGLAVALRPLQRMTPLRRVVATVLEPVSTAGRRGLEVLEGELHDLLNGREPEPSPLFPQRVAFNLIPESDQGRSGGGARSAAVVREHLRRLLGDAHLAVEVTRVRVPVFFGLGIAVDVVLQEAVPAAELERQLREAPGLLWSGPGSPLPEQPWGLPTPATVVGSDATHIACVRVDPSVPSVAMWIVLDNTRKGSATNAVQIAELLVRDYL